MSAHRAAAAPRKGTVESWCFELITSTCLATKLTPHEPPPLADPASWEPSPGVRRLARPGRPPELVVTSRAARTPRAAALESRAARARLVHTFLHHELQAAELFAWAVLAFPEAPRRFRAGLVRLCRAELAHLALYARHLETLGARVGDVSVRDWFWERVPNVRDAAGFVALLGLGLEAANLDHSARFAAAFEAAGDAEGAALLRRVERDEVRHVAFAARWFARLTGAPLDYARWRAALPAPLSPALFQGRPLNRAARARAGLDDAFLAALEREPATHLGARP
jgi:uncharacterized ferritin-like protein (DUF455 family)